MAGPARPVLGIICCRRAVGAEIGQTVLERYAIAALKYADCAGLLVPSMPDLMQASEVAGRLDGLLLTGSPSNVYPSRYGEAVEDPPGPRDHERDETMLRMVDSMLAAKRPVFGICRGFQEINVAFGGTLRRDVSEDGRPLEHHAPQGVSLEAMFEYGHPVKLTPGGVLRHVYGSDRLDVNSVHYQGAARLGGGLNVEAVAPDGLVEAISASVNGAPVLAVQWHPEWRPQDNEQSQTFFSLLGRALRGETIEDWTREGEKT